MKVGIYQYYWGGVGGAQRYVAVVAELLAHHHDVEIVHHRRDFDPARVAEALDVDLSRVRFRFEPERLHGRWGTNNPWKRLRCEAEWCADLSAPYEVFIDSSDRIPYFCHAPRGVLLTHFPLVTFEEYHGRLAPTWTHRPWPLRAARAAFQRLEWRRRFATYDLCLVNSQYTKYWFERLWGPPAQVLYPPLREGFAPQAKQPLILAIGAFHHSSHKRQDVLVQNFAELCRAGLADWRLVLVGAVGPRPEDRAYVERLRSEGSDLPMEIRTDVSARELRDLLAHAAILWHAMGYGVDAQRDPSRLEHFGMVITEAMAAGAVPIAFRGGGIPEMIAQGENGVLWSSFDELRQATLEVAGDVALRTRMAAAAVERSRDFSAARFQARLFELLAAVLRQPVAA
ncbi:MAG: glycosyltransferase family 4 protein [Pirellulales bacterium]|nr:glycosyltransferase family 4 protein [Pirellulales bacterium]